MIDPFNFIYRQFSTLPSWLFESRIDVPTPGDVAQRGSRILSHRRSNEAIRHTDDFLAFLSFGKPNHASSRIIG
jgi:hypothetical protein